MSRELSNLLPSASVPGARGDAEQGGVRVRRCAGLTRECARSPRSGARDQRARRPSSRLERLGGGNAARVAKRRPEDRQSMQASRTCRGPVRTHVVRGDGLAGLREGDPVPGGDALDVNAHGEGTAVL